MLIRLFILTLGAFPLTSNYHLCDLPLLGGLEFESWKAIVNLFIKTTLKKTSDLELTVQLLRLTTT